MKVDQATRLNLTTTHVADDTREPEMKKAASWQPRSELSCLHWRRDRTF